MADAPPPPPDGYDPPPPPPPDGGDYDPPPPPPPDGGDYDPPPPPPPDGDVYDPPPPPPPNDPPPPPPDDPPPPSSPDYPPPAPPPDYPPPAIANTTADGGAVPAPTGPAVHKSVGPIAGGSAAAIVMLLAVAVLYLLAAHRRRRAVPGSSPRRRRAVRLSSTEAPPSVAAVTTAALVKGRLPAASPAAPQEQESKHLSPPPTSFATSATLSAASGESSKSHGGDYREPMPAAENETLDFRGAFTYENLAAATNGFADSNLVGRGGFGDVYVGEVDGALVAVKRLRVGGQQGDKEFQTEVRIMGRVHHRNLVSLVGYCVADGGHRLLVYEFVRNMTLQHHLHGRGATTILDWSTRWKIAVGTAKGLAYLHEDCHPRIIHRDLKPANILLDQNFNPKVSDFGMAKFIPAGRDTHVSTRIVGTIGYLAPEYAISGRLTEKSDVFSYGVVLLELITGMKAAISSHPDEEDTLVGWAGPLIRRALELSDYDELVDPLLESFDMGQMARLLRCAAAAVSSSARRRPRMSQIVRYLEGDTTSAKEIEAGGDVPYGGSGSVQSYPVKYNEIRRSRIDARV